MIDKRRPAIDVHDSRHPVLTIYTAMIRYATQSDAQQIALIYNHYIENTTITFEEEPISAEEMARRISDVQQGGLPWLVMEDENGINGYAYATKWRVRPAYQFSVETTVYFSREKTGCGLGGLLYQKLIEELRERG